jgi:hypothetical protein
MVKRSVKGGDFSDQRKEKYYLSIDEWIALLRDIEGEVRKVLIY